MNKIGIFGGSFDPVHEAHISLAKDALQQCELDSVIFVPAKIQPFKAGRDVTAVEDRLAMVRLGIAGEPGMDFSEFECRSEGISYSYLTMRYMADKYKNTDLYMIMGTDSFLMIEKWKNSKELLQNYSFIVGSRPGYREDELKECISRLRNEYGVLVVNIDNIKMDISSTDIRNRIRDGRSILGLVPESVERYIQDRGLYRD